MFQLKNFFMIFKYQNEESAVEIFRFQFNYSNDKIKKYSAVQITANNNKCVKELLETLNLLGTNPKWDGDIDLMLALNVTEGELCFQ